jgi:hypothetical protein
MQAGIEQATGISDLDRTGPPMKQREPKLFLEPTDLMTESGGRYVKLLGGFCEAEVTGDGLERPECVQRWQRT